MTAAQRTMLFSLFARIAKAMARKTSEQKDALRAEITLDLFGEAISWGNLTNKQIGRLKRRLVAMLNPQDIAAQRADSPEGDEAAERNEIITGIEREMAAVGFSEAYVRTISVDAADWADWRTLPIGKLRNLRKTIANRARQKPLFRRSRRVDVVPARHC